ncbi:NUDIX hydrolase [Kineosporia sp. J2-2]|uniref:NUDIX hydrolase n=2 Tax=Kineosporia corallincola TaxID=2835133 RepID=A0ABS5TBE5_9ACTN|nr:NUDIX hydrolase [Kineosporia corallincola]
MGAGVLLTDPEQRVLLVEPVYQDTWLLPGGIVEAGESPRAGAFREVHEELGLRMEPGRLLVVDWGSKRPDGGDSLNWLFAGSPVAEAEIRLQAEELRAWAWCTPAEVDRLAHPRIAREIAAALTALREGHTLYLENGHPVDQADQPPTTQ